jgi:hypothetical protein
MVDRIERAIELEGELTPEQRTRLLEIANRCPVHRTLTSEIRIESRLGVTAVANDAVLLARNIRDFAGIPGLRVEGRGAKPR